MDTCLASVVGASYYWCQTSIHHVHWDGYWDVGQCVWRIAGTGGEVQLLSGDWRLRWVLLNWLGVTCGAFQPVACVVAPSARGQEDEYNPYWHRGAFELRAPGRQAFPGPRASCGGPEAEPGWWCILATAERYGPSDACSVWRPTHRCIKQPDTRWDMLYAC